MSMRWNTNVVLAIALLSLQFARADVKTQNCELQLDATSDASVIAAYQFGQRLNTKQMLEKLEILSGYSSFPGGTRLGDRYSGPARELTRRWIVSQLTASGLRPELEVFEGGANVVVEIPGRDRAGSVVEMVVNFTSKNRSSGADDNGSGVALLMQLAEAFKSSQHNNTIRLVFLDDARNRAGGVAHAINAKQDPRRFVGAIVVDQIGYFPERAAKKFAIVNLFNGKMLGKIKKGSMSISPDAVNQAITALAAQIFYQSKRLPMDRGVDLSPEPTSEKDATAIAYWKNGLAAVTTSSVMDEDYRRTSYDDDFRNLNLDYYQSVAKTIAELAGSLAGVTSAANPTGDLIAKENHIVSLDDPLPAPIARDLQVKVKVEEPPKKRPAPVEIRSRDSAPSDSDVARWSELLRQQMGVMPNGYETLDYLSFWQLPVEKRIVMIDSTGAVLRSANPDGKNFRFYLKALIKKMTDEVKERGGTIVMVLGSNLDEMGVETIEDIGKKVLEERDKDSALRIEDSRSIYDLNVRRYRPTKPITPTAEQTSSAQVDAKPSDDRLESWRARLEQKVGARLSPAVVESYLYFWGLPPEERVLVFSPDGKSLVSAVRFGRNFFFEIPALVEIMRSEIEERGGYVITLNPIANFFDFSLLPAAAFEHLGKSVIESMPKPLTMGSAFVMTWQSKLFQLYVTKY